MIITDGKNVVDCWKFCSYHWYEKD